MPPDSIDSPAPTLLLTYAFKASDGHSYVGFPSPLARNWVISHLERVKKHRVVPPLELRNATVAGWNAEPRALVGRVNICPEATLYKQGADESAAAYSDERHAETDAELHAIRERGTAGLARMNDAIDGVLAKIRQACLKYEGHKS